MRVGLFGGSFDPIHLGHLLLAETCREAAALDEVWFVPAAVSPHKLGRVATEGRHRLQMLNLAVGGYPPFVTCDWELQRGGVSYTVDTLEHLRGEFPAAEIFLLMGADSLLEFNRWRQPARICQLATPLIVSRPTAPPPDVSRLDALVTVEQRRIIEQHQVLMPLIEISSSDLRRRIQAGQSIRYRTPRAVEKYIEAQSLYR